MRTEEVMLTAALHGCVIAVGLGGAVLVLCLGNWLVALLAIAHVCFVIACSIAAMVWFGWQVGFNVPKYTGYDPAAVATSVRLKEPVAALLLLLLLLLLLAPVPANSRRNLAMAADSAVPEVAAGS